MKKISKVVSPLFNSSVVQSPWRGAAFARENVGRKQVSASKPLQVYNRARYYDTATGEFISRDPLEYVDGMSLYRGYFVPGAMDPKGTETTVTSVVRVKSAGCCPVPQSDALTSAFDSACQKIKNTFERLQRYRDVIKRRFPNPGFPMGDLGNLSDADFAKVISNLEAAVKCCGDGSVTLDCGTRGNGDHCQTSPNNPGLYTRMNRYTYNASSDIFVCQEFFNGQESVQINDMAHEIGRKCSKQFEDGTGDPIWDVRRWDTYIERMNNPRDVSVFEEDFLGETGTPPGPRF